MKEIALLLSLAADATVKEITKAINALSSKISNLEKTNADLTELNTAQANEISALQTTLKNDAITIEGITTQVAELEASLQAANNDLLKSEQKVNDCGTVISELSAEYKDLHSKLTVAETQLKNLSTGVSSETALSPEQESYKQTAIKEHLFHLINVFDTHPSLENVFMFNDGTIFTDLNYVRQYSTTPGAGEMFKIKPSDLPKEQAQG